MNKSEDKRVNLKISQSATLRMKIYSSWEATPTGKSYRKSKMRSSLSQKNKGSKLDLVISSVPELSVPGSGQVEAAGPSVGSCQGDPCTGWEVGWNDL